jgi:hypothetical protein
MRHLHPKLTSALPAALSREAAQLRAALERGRGENDAQRRRLDEKRCALKRLMHLAVGLTLSARQRSAARADAVEAARADASAARAAAGNAASAASALETEVLAARRAESERLAAETAAARGRAGPRR